MRHALVYLLFGVAACGAAAEPLLIPRRTATTARQPVTTTPWVTYDDKYFYVAVRCAYLGSLLYSYKLNWQTLLFVGYGDDRILAERGDLLRGGRTLFVKVSYAFQR